MSSREILADMIAVPPKRPLEEEPSERLLNLKGSQFIMPTPPAEESPAFKFQRELSPAASISTLSSIQDVSSIGDPEAQKPLHSAQNDARPAKRRKLTSAEKLEQQREKEVKAREKAEAKVQRDQEKAIEQAKKEEAKRERDEQKLQKDEEKRRKAEDRENKKREKELEEERKAQEKLSKERKQMRLGAFFQKPATTQQDAPSREASPEKVMARRRSMSLETFDAVQHQMKDNPARTPSKTAISTLVPATPRISDDYHKYFLPFENKENRTWHPPRLPGREDEAQARFDADMRSSTLPEKYDLGISRSYADLADHFQHCRSRRGIATAQIKTLVQRIENTLKHSIDLTQETQDDGPRKLLSEITMRHLHFHEDLRPAYFGTYTRTHSEQTTKKLRRNPFAKERTDTDYDYDSEAEWMGDPDDEEIPDDEVRSIDDEEEVNDFLDDENDELRAPIMVSDLQAHCTGLCWEDASGKLGIDQNASPSKAMRGLRLQFLLPDFKGTCIDPFSTSYWQTAADLSKSVTAEMASLRPPLKERSSNTGSVKLENGWSMLEKDGQNSAKKRVKPGTQKTMSVTELEQFKAATVGSLLGKAELLTVLKDKFPTFTAVLIKDTLGEKFAQIGKTKADKKWVYVGAT